jgi:hypothetical protein
MQTNAYGYLGIGPPIGPPRGVSSISVFRRLLSSADVAIGPPRGVCSISVFRRLLGSADLVIGPPARHLQHLGLQEDAQLGAHPGRVLFAP